MPDHMDDVLRTELRARRSQLERVATRVQDHTEIRMLLADVDAALERVTAGTYGLCEVCREPTLTTSFLAHYRSAAAEAGTRQTVYDSRLGESPRHRRVSRSNGPGLDNHGG